MNKEQLVERLYDIKRSAYESRVIKNILYNSFFNPRYNSNVDDLSCYRALKKMSKKEKYYTADRFASLCEYMLQNIYKSNVEGVYPAYSNLGKLADKYGYTSMCDLDAAIGSFVLEFTPLYQKLGVTKEEIAEYVNKYLEENNIDFENAKNQNKIASEIFTEMGMNRVKKSIYKKGYETISRPLMKTFKSFSEEDCLRYLLSSSAIADKIATLGQLYKLDDLSRQILDGQDVTQEVDSLLSRALSNK